MRYCKDEGAKRTSAILRMPLCLRLYYALLSAFIKSFGFGALPYIKTPTR